MILYHGTNVDFESINLEKSHKYKDFGQGFYLTDIRSQAEQLAAKKAKLFGGYPIIQEYEFNEEFLLNGELRYLSSIILVRNGLSSYSRIAIVT